MCDCLWSFICNLCDEGQCMGCKKYISVNSEKGRELLDTYQEQVNKALEPLTAIWKEKFNEYSIN